MTKKIQRGENVKQYLDFMSQLINEQELYTQNPQDAKASAKHQQAKNVARGLTLNILNRLNDWDDYVVKGQVINFLYESHLIGYYQQQDNNLTQAIISLKYANLKKTEINLSNGLLDGINLEGTSLQNTNLSEMTLRYTNFSNAHLEYAKLNTSDLSNANLQQAFLQNADLSNAFLTGANLQNAQLCGTKLINVRDSETANFKDAIYDDTTEFGNILNSEAGRKMQSKMKKGICNPVS
ncbi:MAG TPA: pentapeptide repeat-containing protein [Nostocaceae cyanobacterium]|nr:pentapeptide repeat-containing protein [Nostocaceae cyanobacterium]